MQKGVTMASSKIHTLDFNLVKEPMDSLLEACANKIEREWPPQLAPVGFGREFFLGTIRVCAYTYFTVRWVCADKPKDPSRKLEYCLSLPPCLRTILDSLFNVLFVLEEFPERLVWYQKSGWREEKERLDRYLTTYGSLPEWQDWLKTYKNHVERGKQLFGIAKAEEANLKAIKYWPNPGKMPKYRNGKSVPTTREFMVYVNDWFYRDLSAESHMSARGLMVRGGPLMKLTGSDHDYGPWLSQFKGIQLGMALVLSLVLISEIEVFFNFGLRPRVRYLWTILNEHIPFSKEIFKARYEGLLPA
jgi:hypothetical protein